MLQPKYIILVPYIQWPVNKLLIINDGIKKYYKIGLKKAALFG